MDDAELEGALSALALTLVDQRRARVVVEPKADSGGYWFGGGNLVAGPGGELLLVGRYRNAGDSTWGLAKGERGAELAVFGSTDGGRSFAKRLSLSKADLGTGGLEVLSIEGAALARAGSGWELLVSTEKAGVPYPAGLESHRKPGTGVWSVDRLAASELEGLARAKPEPLNLASDPGGLHVKDPVLWFPGDGSALLAVCTHPFSWASSNTAVTRRPAGAAAFDPVLAPVLPRGPAWDVAAARLTEILSLPGELLGGTEPVNLLFYDGAECLRKLEEGPNAVRRPRGYSCEELGGLAWFRGSDPAAARRISRWKPLFVSPWGTGCSRYLHACADGQGLHAAWQQGRDSGAQPLVMNSLSWDEVRAALAEGRRAGAAGA